MSREFSLPESDEASVVCFNAMCVYYYWHKPEGDVPRSSATLSGVLEPS